MKKLKEIPIVFFDGSCNLCHSAVNFLQRLDKKQILYYAPLRGKTFQSLRLNNLDLPDSLVFYYQGKVFYKSKAILAILTLLPYPYRIFTFLGILPTNILDKIYDFIAKKRYLWSGKKNFCEIPVHAKAHLFLD